MMDDIANYCFHLSRSQGMSNLRASRGNYDTVSILRGVEPPSQTFVANRIIRIPPDGVL